MSSLVCSILTNLKMLMSQNHNYSEKHNIKFQFFKIECFSKILTIFNHYQKVSLSEMCILLLQNNIINY